MGVALGHSRLVAPHLERGTLVSLFEPPVAAPARYFLATAPGSGEKPRGAGVPGLAARGDANERGGRGRRQRRPRRKAKAESGATVGGSPRLESALDASLRNGNGGAMRGWRERAIGRLGPASGGAICAKNFCLGSKNQPSGIIRQTGNNSPSEFSRFPRGPGTECAVSAAVPGSPETGCPGVASGTG